MLTYRSSQSASAFTTSIYNFYMLGSDAVLFAFAFILQQGLGWHKDTPSDVLWNACADLRLGNDTKAEMAVRRHLFVQWVPYKDVNIGVEYPD